MIIIACMDRKCLCKSLARDVWCNGTKQLECQQQKQQHDLLQHPVQLLAVMQPLQCAAQLAALYVQFLGRECCISVLS